MSVECMLHNTILAVNTLTRQVEDLTEATAELVEVTKAVHRERVVELRQLYDEAKGDDNPKRINFTMFWLHERLQALEMKTGGILPQFEDHTPASIKSNGNAKVY